MKPLNQIIIIADEHARSALGCYGHPIVRTPNLDALAQRGTRFTDTYCNSPICVPSRASFATGRPVFELGNWDNASPYTGTVPSWAHKLRDAGQEVVSIGKLHYRNELDDTGFSHQINPMHLYEGIGDLRSLLRDPLPPPRKQSKNATLLGPGSSTYISYDLEITDATVKWLHEAGLNRGRAPWTLFVSLVCPHPPYIAPPEFFANYDPALMPLQKGNRSGDPAPHPWIAAMRGACNDDDFFTPESRRLAIANYYGMCTFNDRNVGRILEALAAAGLDTSTRIIYTSDHGETLGTWGIWGKMTCYDESATVPLIVAGPDVAAGHVVHTPTSLLDLYPTLLDGAGLNVPASAGALRGASLYELLQRPDDLSRPVFCEYHAHSSPSAALMLRRGRYKLIHYHGYTPELFDLFSDPDEIRNLSADPAYSGLVDELSSELHRIVDPAALDQRVKFEQAKKIIESGGREAILARGIYQGSPVPGEVPTFIH